MVAKAIPKPDFMEQAEWDILMTTREPEIIKAGARAHVKLYLDTDGGGTSYTTQGAPTLLLGTTGRRSGVEQIAPANFMQRGDDVIVVGSIAGLDRHPHWALNLDANSEAWVQVKAKRWPVTAHRVLGGERAELWPRLTEYFPLWGHFQKYCDREFLVFVLSPKEA